MSPLKIKTDNLIGAFLQVFEDPFARQKPEGMATVIRVVRRGTEDGSPNIEWADCWVRFAGMDEPEVYRTIAYI